MDKKDSLWWKERIRLWAQDLGFLTAGFTSAESHQALKESLEVRESLGLLTPFISAPAAQRYDPRALWPECATVVALAFPLPLSLPPEKGEGVIARSAIGEDYHTLLQHKLNALIERMNVSGWPGGRPRFQADTGPLGERAFAVRAGIGWLGRNHQLIVPGYGSFVALALLLLDQAIPPDQILQGNCGECRLCREACPAQLLEREHFEAEKCLSYLTQTKAVLGKEESLLLGNRLFGCDTCQEACPQNRLRLERESSAAAFPRGYDPFAVISLTKEDFKKRFASTAAGWRGKSILQRNAFLILKNAQDERLERWLKERREKQDLPPILHPYID